MKSRDVRVLISKQNRLLEPVFSFLSQSRCYAADMLVVSRCTTVGNVVIDYRNCKYVLGGHNVFVSSS